MAKSLGRPCAKCGEDDWYIRKTGAPYCRNCAITRSKAYYIEHHYNDEEYRIKENAWKRDQKRRKRALAKEVKDGK